MVPLIISGEIMVLKPLYCSKNGIKLISDIVSLLLLDIWRISSYEDEIIPISYYIAGNAHLVWGACLLMSAESKLLLGMSHVDQTGKCPHYICIDYRVIVYGLVWEIYIGENSWLLCRTKRGRKAAYPAIAKNSTVCWPTALKKRFLQFIYWTQF